MLSRLPTDDILVILTLLTFILPLLRGVSIEAGGSPNNMGRMAGIIFNLNPRNLQSFLTYCKVRKWSALHNSMAFVIMAMHN